MNNIPLVSVIVPIFNVEQYVEKSIESICSQTYNNFEIVLVNDGSQDSSIQIAVNVIERNNVNYKVVNQENQGLPAARNAGIKVASGEYLCFIDSDDIISKDHLTNSISGILKNDVPISYSDFECTKMKLRKGNDMGFNGTEILDVQDLLEKFSTRTIKIHCCSLVVSSKFLQINNIQFNSKLRYGEDIDFMWRTFSEISKIVHIKQRSYKYLIRNNSIMNKKSVEKWSIFLDEFKNTISNLKLKHAEYDNIYDVTFNRAMIGLLHTVARNSEWTTYKAFSDLIDLKNIQKYLCSSGNLSVRLTARLVQHKRIFYIIARVI